MLSPDGAPGRYCHPVADETEVGARLVRPGHWVVQRVERSGWFTTGLTWDRRDGTSAIWSSRAARRRARVELRDVDGRPAGHVDGDPATARRLTRLNLLAAVAFVLGGSFFSLGAFLAGTGTGTVRTVDVVYLVGGVFFSLGGYLSVLQASNSPTCIDAGGMLSSPRWRWWRADPRHLGWLSAAVLFVGTLFFAVSLVAAFAEDLTPRQSDGWIWLPDMIGCVCFLLSGHLALLEVCQGRPGLRPRDVGWWVVAVNQVGSVLFFLAGLAAFVRPATSEEVDAGLVNWGTFAGALCFVVGGVVQAFERPAAPSDRRGAPEA
jgi:hypothetical protein